MRFDIALIIFIKIFNESLRAAQNGTEIFAGVVLSVAMAIIWSALILGILDDFKEWWRK